MTNPHSEPRSGVGPTGETNADRPGHDDGVPPGAAGTELFERAYAERFPSSSRAYQRACTTFPSGVNHDGKYMAPFPLTFACGDGGVKWDVDGHEIVDLVMGHGALLLGHGHPAVVEAVTEQVARGTHLAGNSELELECGERLTNLVPSAERVRFVSTGTEATLLALRVARAATGRQRFIRFHGHFHGWHDVVLLGNRLPFDQPTSTGIPDATFDPVIVLPPGNLAAVDAALEAGDVAAVIVEPAGGTQGKVPADPEWIRGLRSVTERRGVVLIFDEVVSGFRSSPGGAQQRIGVTPDLTTLAKALCGGFPGGAVVGRADVMEVLSFGDARGKVAHPGTFNANPVAMAACRACLDLLATGEPQVLAERAAQRLRDGVNQAFARHGVNGRAYGEDSTIHLHLGGDASTPTGLLQGGRTAARWLRAPLLYQGLDLLGSHGWTSFAHEEAAIDAAIAAVDAALCDLPSPVPNEGDPPRT